MTSADDTQQRRSAGERLKEAIHVARARSRPPMTSDTQLSLRAQVHYDTLQNWYSGRTVPRPSELRKVADALGIRYADLQDVYDGRDPEPPTLVEAIEALIAELRLGRAEQAAATQTILRALGVMLPELLAQPANGAVEPRRR